MHCAGFRLCAMHIPGNPWAGSRRASRADIPQKANAAWRVRKRMDDVRERFQNLHEFLKAAKFKLNRNNWDYIVDFYNRSQAAGFAPQFCFTVDLAFYSRRERDVVKRHNRIANRSAEEHRNLAGLDWGTIERFQKRFPKAQIVIKGIQTAEDAKLCLDHGIASIYVTNHGGRAVEHWRGGGGILYVVCGGV